MNTHPDVILKILLAFILGVIIGFDRDRCGKAAGARTQMLICVGAALLSSMSIELPEILGPGGFRLGGDPARLMAQVVAGIGFVGAGVIIKGNKSRVTGITTAATIWVTAAIGLAIGAGFYIPALFTTACVLFLAPIATLQYRVGLKVNVYALTLRTRSIKGVEVELRKLKISSTVIDRKDHTIMMKIFSSEQKNRQLTNSLENKHIRYSLNLLEE